MNFINFIFKYTFIFILTVSCKVGINDINEDKKTNAGKINLNEVFISNCSIVLNNQNLITETNYYLEAICESGTNIQYKWTGGSANNLNSNKILINEKSAGTKTYTVLLSNSKNSSTVSIDLNFTAIKSSPSLGKSKDVSPSGCQLLANQAPPFKTNNNYVLSVNCSQGTNLLYNWTAANLSSQANNSVYINENQPGNYTYYVNVSNSLGSADLEISLQIDEVIDGCILISNSKTMRFNESTKLIMKCAKGSNINYKWIQNQVVLDETSSTLSLDNPNIGALDIKVYASNYLGSQEQGITINVIKPDRPPELCSLNQTADLTLLMANCDSGTNLKYIWKRNNVSQTNISSTFSLNNLAEGTYEFEVKIFNNSGEVNLTKSLKISTKPLPPSGCMFTLLPNSDYMLTSESLKISAKCEGGEKLKYNWKKDNNNLNIISNQIEIKNQIAGTYNYTLTISNESGSVTLNKTIFVNNQIIAPSDCSISISPNSTTMLTNESKYFTVYCSKGSNLSYTWKKDGLSIGNNNNSILLSNLQVGNYTISATVFNSFGSVEKEEIITVKEPTIAPSGCSLSIQPLNTTMEINELKNINVKCTSGNSLNYNWFKNGVSLGKTLSSLDIVGTSAGNFTYSVTISNTAGTVTLTQNLTINSPQVAPSSCYILASPIGQSMNTNESKKLTVTCSNGTDLKYTWTKNGTAYSNGSNSIQISNLAAGNYEFNANISNSIGSVSNTFTINVNAIQSIARCTQASNILSASLKNYSGIYNQTFSETVPSGSIESFPFTISKSIYPAGIKFSLEAGFNEGAYNSTDVSISECPGAFTGLPTGCAMINRASPNISATYIKLAGISCVIQEGKTYYLNIRPSAGSPSAAPVISPQQF